MATRDLESMEPHRIYAVVAETDEDEFAAMMEEPATRERVIDALIAHMVDLFRPERAGDVEAVIHIKLWDRPGGGYEHFELRIADRSCELEEGPSGDDPDLTLKVRPTDLRKLLIGETGARRLALKGRLRVIGDVKLGMKLPDLFDF